MPLSGFVAQINLDNDVVVLQMDQQFDTVPHPRNGIVVVWQCQYRICLTFPVKEVKNSNFVPDSTDEFENLLLNAL
jgi:hypothetical protein